MKLYRAVEPKELSDVICAQRLIHRSSSIGKYFAGSAEDAARFARSAFQSLSHERYTLLEATFPDALGATFIRFWADGMWTWIVPASALPSATIRVMKSMPIRR